MKTKFGNVIKYQICCIYTLYCNNVTLAYVTLFAYQRVPVSNAGLLLPTWAQSTIKKAGQV